MNHTTSQITILLIGLISITITTSSTTTKPKPFCWIKDETKTIDSKYNMKCHCNSITSCVNIATQTNCTALPRCYSIKGTGSTNGCGWCWDIHNTTNRIVGGLWGNKNGPATSTCNDWTFYSSECKSHVYCKRDIPACQGILSTNCGWCNNQYATKGNIFGPSKKNECSNSYIWDHSKCPTIKNTIEQVHVSFTNLNASKYGITFASDINTNNGTLIFYTTTNGNDNNTSILIQYPIDKPTNFIETNDNGLQYIYRVLLDINGTNIFLPDRIYKYQIQLCKNNNNNCYLSKLYELKTRRYDFSNEKPLSILMYGDMGRHGGGQILGSIKNELLGKGVTSTTTTTTDAIIHIGDFGYDLQSNNGLNGDTFLQRIESIATSIPYMTCPGNHEIQINGETNAAYFAHYRNRFTMPLSMNNNGLNMWYSFNFGLVHFIAFSSEVFFAASNDVQERMLTWLKKDLEQANLNRKDVPWIVTFAHRPMYCSNSDGDDCTKINSKTRLAVEELFHLQGVDLDFSAHEHSYERLYPVYNYTISKINNKNTTKQNCINDIGCQGITYYKNMESMVHIVSGAAGCNENSGACLNPIKEARGPWSAFHLSAEGTYSYGRLTVYNETTLRWQVVIAEEERVVDDLMLVQMNGHGKRGL